MDSDRILREREVLRMLGKNDGGGRTTLWRWERAGIFPRRRKLSGRSVGWLLSEVLEWMKTRPQAGGRGISESL